MDLPAPVGIRQRVLRPARRLAMTSSWGWRKEGRPNTDFKTDRAVGMDGAGSDGHEAIEDIVGNERLDLLLLQVADLVKESHRVNETVVDIQVHLQRGEGGLEAAVEAEAIQREKVVGVPVIVGAVDGAVGELFVRVVHYEFGAVGREAESVIVCEEVEAQEGVAVPGWEDGGSQIVLYGGLYAHTDDAVDAAVFIVLDWVKAEVVKFVDFREVRRFGFL